MVQKLRIQYPGLLYDVMKWRLCIVQTAVFLALSAARVGAFSLLGPYASWMDQTL